MKVVGIYKNERGYWNLEIDGLTYVVDESYQMVVDIQAALLEQHTILTEAEEIATQIKKSMLSECVVCHRLINENMREQNHGLCDDCYERKTR